ncbi:small-conductance mechanosensitive channel [Chromohalobacter marismortui]|uniref:Small-conductance mechanosensitive channel n=1 Tax=Chromohalobacter marismortui TaxID=42055 RepID=A0A4R7NS06_9GAMM|nr:MULTISPECIES: mechanosensitive ion channel family protein [Chromohalobacter]MCI0511316.1 mechanosensitive ion channel [Chromohalobacter sp.]MCI0594072.1 mechanosensitive ion channel [Chromohalobacter sp.]TDU23667.1 small-conductance mechanosensitive channel [Chromohalobacter marismortui]
MDKRAAHWGRWLVLLCALLVFSSAAWGQIASPMAALSGAGGSQGAQAPSNEQARESLDSVIAMLEDQQRRDALLTQLRALRASLEGADAKAESPSGLLGAIAESLTSLSDAGDVVTPLEYWRRLSARAGDTLMQRFTSLESLVHLVGDFAWVLGLWGGSAALMVFGGRSLAKRLNMQLTLSAEPSTWMLIRHMLRRLLPWGLAFGMTLGVVHGMTSTLGKTLAMVIAYITLCGILFTAVCEVVFSLFANGHRRVALRILHRRAARWLFVIGALVALGDAANASELRSTLGASLAEVVSMLANVTAALLTGAFALRFKRPIKHLIRNRPYRYRRDKRASSELIQVVGTVWHMPVLLMVVVSLIAILTSEGDSRSAFAKAIVTAGLLVVTLIVNGLIHRHAEQPSKVRRQSQYRRRLVRFGYTLAHLMSWVVFAELAMRVWGLSLLVFGSDEGISQRIGQSLISIGMTLLLAWLVWILADTAIERALLSSKRGRSGRAQSTRAQTITPLIRNVVFATIVIIAFIVALANLGVNVTPLLAGAGVIGLAVGFGAQTLVQDLITGLFILIEDSLAIDDFVDLSGHMGTVEGLSLRTVRLRDLDGIVHTIPFSQIKGIQNFSREFGVALLRIRVAHHMQIDDAIAIVREVAEELRRDPMMRHYIWSPLELQGVESFDAGAAILRVRMRTAPVMQWDVARAFNLRLKRRFDELGVELAMPRMSVSLEQASDASGRLPAAAEQAPSTSGVASDAPADTS